MHALNAHITLFERLYGDHRHWLMVAAYSFLKQQQEAEEIVQDFFTDVWEKQLFKQMPLEDTGRLRNWLFIAVRNRCLNRLAKRGGLPDWLELSDTLEENAYLPHLQLENRELGNELAAAVRQLPARQQELFSLAYLQDRPQQEIAERMNISKGTVKKAMQNALRSLRRNLKNR